MPRKLSKQEVRSICAAIDASTNDVAERQVLRHKVLLGPEFMSTRDFLEGFTKILDKKTGAMGAWLMNAPQRTLQAARLRNQRAGRPERYATLKARKWGISTWWLLENIADCVRNDHYAAAIVADENSTSSALLEAGRVICDALPYKLPRKYDNRSVISFGSPLHSTLDIDTAKADDPLRGLTKRAVHCTEPQIWPNPEKASIAIENAVADTTGTVISYEGTGYGLGTWWHKFWFDAHEGRNDFEAFFFAWHADPSWDYCVLPSDEEHLHILDTLDDEEQSLIRLYGVNVGQINWRRRKIRNTFKGSLDLFHQEYPSTPSEAFLASGRPAYVRSFVLRAQTRCKDPVWVGDISVGEYSNTHARLDYKLRPNPDGLLRIWHEPHPDRGYVMASDTGHGVEGGDKSCTCVIDVESCEQVASLHGLLRPREFGRMTAALGFHYNTAHWWPETEGVGTATLEAARECEYPRIGRRPIYDAQGKLQGRKLGWSTNVKTRPMIGEEIRDHLVLNEEGAQFNSVSLGDEMLAQVVDEMSREDHPTGGSDDEIVAWGVALIARKDCVNTGHLEELDEAKPRTIDENHWRDFRAKCDTDPEMEEEEEWDESEESVYLGW